MYHFFLKIESDSSKIRQHNFIEKYGLTDYSKQYQQSKSNFSIAYGLLLQTPAAVQPFHLAVEGSGSSKCGKSMPSIYVRIRYKI